MSPIIEEYLRASGVRYFRGHRDDEYFFLAEALAGMHQGRLHVRLGVGADRGEVELVITPDRYYPGARRERIATAAAQWAVAASGLEVELHQSADPALVGVAVSGRCRPAGTADLTGFVDRTVAAAVDFFAALSTRVAPPDEDGLRDAG